jgi:putative exosortase-associated protein (TIGR04073 family)
MKKGLIFLLSLIILISFLNGPLYAANALTKLVRGTINFLVSPLEFFQAIGDAWNEHDNAAVALPLGVVYGSWNMVKRAGIGLFEIVTFPFPVPYDYKPLIENPVFLGEKLEEQEPTAGGQSTPFPQNK